jgi:hypothetical protein
MKKMALIIMAVCMIATLSIATAQAGWYTVNVVATGASNGTSLINLTDVGGAFTGQWFVIDSVSQNQNLATALTAMSAGLKCQVFANATGTPPPYTYITALYIYSN